MARYVAISESEMSDFMGAIGFTELSVEQRGSFGRKPVKERVYEAPVGAGRIRVYSSVVGPATRDRGKDAIRVQYWVGDQKVYGSKRVHRTQNWRKNLLQRTEEIRESVESGPLSRIPKDSRGDLMTARRSRLPHERFWGSVNYPDIRESRRFEAASVLPKELKTDKITDRVMAWQYLIDDSEKQHQLLKLQTALKMGLITQDEILESLDRAMSKRIPTEEIRESLGAESKLSMAKKEELILEHLNKNRQTSKYDGKFENTEGGVVELLGITRAGVSKTLRDMEARGLIYARNLHVPGGRRKVQCWYVVGSGTDRGFGAETIYVRQMGDADQERIENELRSALRTEFQEMSPEEIESLVELGLDSKLSDLNNVIDIEMYEAESFLWAAESRESKVTDFPNHHFGYGEAEMIAIAFPEGMSWETYEKRNDARRNLELLGSKNLKKPMSLDVMLDFAYNSGWRQGISDEKTKTYRSEEGSAPIQRPMEFGEPVNWTPLDGTPSLKRRRDAESFTPPASAVSAAKKGLAQRKKWGRGGLSPAEAKSQGIDSGVTRARKIASGKVSKHDVRRMSAFNRHRKNNNPSKKMPDGGPTAGTIAWNLWGGSAGVNWAKKKSAAMNAEDFETMCRQCKIGNYESCLYGETVDTGGFWLSNCVPDPSMNAETFEAHACDCSNSYRYRFDRDLTAVECDRCGGYLDAHKYKVPSAGVVKYAEDEEETLEELYEDYLEELDTYGHDGSVMSKSEYGRYLKTFDAEENLDYNSFNNDMEALLAKYSQLLLNYNTKYQSKGRGGDGIMEVFMRFKPYNAYFDAEEKLSKTSCCCGATESNPCACMKAATPMSCSAIEPKCACYKDLEKNAEEKCQMPDYQGKKCGKGLYSSRLSPRPSIGRKTRGMMICGDCAGLESYAKGLGEWVDKYPNRRHDAESEDYGVEPRWM
ncbi:hypothetical protein N9M03_00670 [bacterium]|nr:hypothetical protein [bacterium]